MSLKFRTLSVLLPLFCAFGLLLFPGAATFAQSASVSGRVIDPSSAVVRKAQITFTDLTKGTSQTTRTNDDGFYSLPFVQPGTYMLTVESNGFKRFERTKITIETAQSLVVDVRLQVGDVSQSVTVDGSGAHINTTDASVSTIIDHQFVENLPLNGRSFQSLMTMVPGVMVAPTANGAAGAGFSGEITVNGQRTEANAFTVDGVSVNTGAQTIQAGYGAGYSGSVPNETALGTTQSIVSIDALQEFRATTSTYSAEYGRTPGGQFIFETRSGANDWHGSLYDYFRNDALDANNYFNKLTTPITPRQAERQNDFGGTLGGPIIVPGFYNGKDRTFFFFSYEGLRLRVPQAARQTYVPDAALRAASPASIQPFLNAFPLPNGTNFGNGIAAFTSGYSSPASTDSSSIRIDQHFGDRVQLFGRFSDVPSSSLSRDINDSDMAVVISQGADIKSLTLGATNTFTPRLTSDLRVNLTWSQGSHSQTTDGFGGATPLSSAFLNAIPGFQQAQTLTFLLDFSNYQPELALQPVSNDQRQLNVVESMNASLGKHNLKWGVDYRRLPTRGSNPAFLQQGTYTSSNEVASNQPDNIYTTLGPSAIHPVYSNFSAFIQDEWKASSRLSLSLGLRWELNPAPTDADGNNPYTITSTDVATLELAPKNTALWHTTYDNFAPRFGFAYQFHQQPGRETVLRAGAGIFYDTGNTPYASTGYQGQGLTTSTTFTGVSFPLSQSLITSIPAPSAAPPYTSEIIGFDPHLKLPYTWQWNVALEQALGRDQTLTLSYIGAAGKRLLRTTYGQAPGNPNFNGGGVEVTTNGATSDYDALQVQFQRKMSHGFQVLASYAWAHALDDVTTNFIVYELLHADSDNDIRHNFQLGLDWQAPGNYQNRVVRSALKDWALDARISSRSALPVDVSGGQAFLPQLGTYQFYQPDRIPNEPLYLYGTQYPGGRIINPAAYKIPTDSQGNYIEGNAGRNSARGFGATQADIALNRTFPLKEGLGLQVRAEAFNVFNQALMGTIYPELTQNTFGYAYQTENYQLGGLNSLYQVGGPRSLQLALRLHF